MLPPGCESVEEIPWDLARGIEHAHRILNWQENLAQHEVPPQWMWPHDHELKVWFDEIKAEREEGRYGGYDDDDPGMVTNDLAAAKRGR